MVYKKDADIVRIFLWPGQIGFHCAFSSDLKKKKKATYGWLCSLVMACSNKWPSYSNYLCGPQISTRVVAVLFLILGFKMMLMCPLCLDSQLQSLSPTATQSFKCWEQEKVETQSSKPPVLNLRNRALWI